MHALETLPNSTPFQTTVFGASSLSLRLPVMLGSAAILFLALVLGLWSALAPLASATLAMGTVVVESNRKVVQHLEGGIVQTVFVKDGDHVSVGDVLIQLDETRLSSAIRTLKPLLAINIAQRARLEAERTSAAAIQFPVGQDGINFTEFQSIENDQTRNFLARHLALTKRLQTLHTERLQSEAALNGLQQQARMHDLHLALVTRDMSVAMVLASSGNGTQQRTRDVAKVIAELQVERAGFSAQTAETELKIEHTSLEAERVQASFIESVELETQQSDREHLDLLDRYSNALDQLRRTRIEAPVAGRIVNLIVHTIGGIVGAGMPLLEIVPDGDRLVIEAQIKPVDVEAVMPGLPVRIRVSGSDARRLPFLAGSVLSVSADRIQDRQRSSSYFLVRIGISQDQVKHFRQDDLRPGMGVEIMITKGEKTIIEYLISPVIGFFADSMHE